jgi:hypothetical protein
MQSKTKKAKEKPPEFAHFSKISRWPTGKAMLESTAKGMKDYPPIERKSHG